MNSPYHVHVNTPSSGTLAIHKVKEIALIEAVELDGRFKAVAIGAKLVSKDRV